MIYYCNIGQLSYIGEISALRTLMKRHLTVLINVREKKVFVLLLLHNDSYMCSIT